MWAPHAAEILLQVGGRRLPLERDGDWWGGAPQPNEDVQDYAFLVNGEGPFPDPRSPCQPQGVHGPSRRIDHGEFEWTDLGFQPGLLSSALFYELHIGTFTPSGTFDAAIERLGHLTDLGVTHVELMPVAEFDGRRGWGYDGVHLFAPHQAYGGPHGLKRFVDACHRSGLAVVLDVVYNHLGPSGNYLERFGPYFTDAYRTPWGRAVNMDGPYSDEVRRFFCDNAAMWLHDYHLDGLRLDAVHAIFDKSAEHFLEQLTIEVAALQAQLGRPLALIAESDLNDPRLVHRIDRGGYGLDAQWSDDFHHALHSLLTGERTGYYKDFGAVSHLAMAVDETFVYAGQYSSYRRRRHGRPALDLPPSRFVVCTQNHDQVGNRAHGERLCHLVGPRLQKVAAALLLTAPQIPLLFQGEEWAATSPFLYFTDHEEALGRLIREGRSSEFGAFGWAEEVADPQAFDTFARSCLNWDELQQEGPRELLDWYRALIHLRQRHRPFTPDTHGARRTRFDADGRWLTVDWGRLGVLCNFADAPRDVPGRGADFEVLLASAPALDADGDRVLMAPESVIIGRIVEARLAAPGAPAAAVHIAAHSPGAPA